jgi:hypothetical protein
VTFFSVNLKGFKTIKQNGCYEYVLELAYSPIDIGLPNTISIGKEMNDYIEIRVPYNHVSVIL